MDETAACFDAAGFNLTRKALALDNAAPTRYRRATLSETEEKKKQHGGAIASIALAIFVLIYFFCPILLALPVLAIYREESKIPESVRSGYRWFFTPARRLSEAWPMYNHLLGSEQQFLAEHCGIHYE